jgi:hypothetical protein
MLIDETARLARDSFFVAVGFGVIGFQKVQVRRRELGAQVQAAEQLTRVQESVGLVAAVVREQIHDLDDRVSSVERHLDDVLDGVEAHLPPPTRDVVHQTRDAARSARSQVVDLFARPTDHPSSG